MYLKWWLGLWGKGTKPRGLSKNKPRGVLGKSFYIILKVRWLLLAVYWAALTFAVEILFQFELSCGRSPFRVYCERPCQKGNVFVNKLRRECFVFFVSPPGRLSFTSCPCDTSTRNRDSLTSARQKDAECKTNLIL